MEEYFASLPAHILDTQIAQALDSGQVDVRLVLELAALLHPKVRVSDELRLVGHKFYRRLCERWRTQNPDVSLTLLPALQAYIALGKEQSRPQPDPGGKSDAGLRRRWQQLIARRHRGKEMADKVRINLQPLADPGFDWSDSRRLLLQIDAIGEDARLWIHDVHERRPHLERVTGLAFQLLKAIEVESLRRIDHGTTPADSTFSSTLEVLQSETDIARQQFVRSAEQSAQRVYAQGMLRRGALLLAAACGTLLRGRANIAM